MANEAIVVASVSASKGGQSVNSVGSTGAASRTFDMTGTDMATVPQAIGFASDEALAIPADVTSPGVLLIANLDSANYVEFSLGTGGAFAASVFEVLKAGMVCIIHPPSGATIYAKANTSAVNITFTVLEAIE